VTWQSLHLNNLSSFAGSKTATALFDAYFVKPQAFLSRSHPVNGHLFAALPGLAHLAHRRQGSQPLEIDFLKGCLQRIEEQRQLQAATGKPLSTSRSKTKGGEPRP